MSIKVFQKFQPNTKRGISKNCEICKKQFGFMARDQHQCKRCFRPICADCGKTKRQVYKIGFTKNPHRLCIVCSKQSDFIKDMVKNNSLKFGQDSSIGKKWLEKVPEQKQPDFIRASSNRQLQRFSFQIFKQMWDAYNFSVRELIGLLTFDKDQKQIYNLARQAYQQILMKGHDQKLQTLLFLIVFFLCFTTPYNCYRIIDFLINLRQTIKDSKTMLEAYLKPLKIQQSQIKKLNDYINYKLKFFMNGFSVNTLTVQCCINLFSRVFERNKVQEFYMVFAIVIEANIQNLITSKDSKMQCDLLLVRNCQMDKIIEKYRVLSSVKANQYLTKNAQITNKQEQSKILPNISQQMGIKLENENWKKTKKASQKNSDSNSNLEQYRIESMKKKTSYQQDQSCSNCRKNKRAIDELSKKLRETEQQLQSLQFKITFSRKANNQDTNKTSSAEQDQELDNKNKQIFKLKMENQLLKQKIHQLQKNSTISNITSNHPSSYMAIDHSQSLQLQKVVQILKKTLDTKNKQLEEIVKKNKLLNYQIQQMQKQYSVKKTDIKQGTRDELLKKIEELSQKINDEQDEKLKLSEQIFELRQSIKSLDSSTSTNDVSTGRKSQCSIF